MTVHNAELWCTGCKSWQPWLDRAGLCETCRTAAPIDPVKDAIDVADELLHDLRSLEREGWRLLGKWYTPGKRKK